MNTTPEPTPAAPLTVGRVALTPERVAVLTALLPFGLLILGVVAVAVLAGKKAPPAPAPAPPAPPAPAPDSHPPAPAPSPEKASAAAADAPSV